MRAVYTGRLEVSSRSCPIAVPRLLNVLLLIAQCKLSCIDSTTVDVFMQLNLFTPPHLVCIVSDVNLDTHLLYVFMSIKPYIIVALYRQIS